MFLVHKKAQKNGYDQSTQWLEANGFIVKKTGYIEPDMKYFDHNKPVPFFENAIDIANYVFKTYPLAGEYMPNEQERKMLYHSAVQTTKNVLMGNDVSIYEDAVLVLETIQLLKDWHRNAEMEKEQENLWAYIYFQYGFNPENSINATQKLYQHFRKAIKNTFVFL